MKTFIKIYQRLKEVNIMSYNSCKRRLNNIHKKTFKRKKSIELSYENTAADDHLNYLESQY